MMEELKGRDFFLVPYAMVNGAYTVPDEMIKLIYRKIEEEGSFNKVFLSGLITDADKFIKYLRLDENIPVFAFFNDKSPAGFAWMNNISGCRCQGHFCYLRKAWGDKCVEISEKILDYWFSLKSGDTHVFDTVVGIVPTQNKFAIKHKENLGMTKVGVIPDYYSNLMTGKKFDALISYIRR